MSVVSKGGNYLLNVGPTGEGIIPRPSVDILTRVGRWIRQYGESVYGTSPSPFPHELPWGFCTFKGGLLYLHVFDWPKDGVLSVNGLNNRVRRSYLLADKAVALTLKKDEEGRLSIALPDAPPDTIDSVVVLEISGRPDIDPFVVQQRADKSLSLDNTSAATRGHAVRRFNRKGEEAQFHISKMQGPEDVVEWRVQIDSPGPYDVLVTYAAISGWEDGRFVVEAGREKISSAVRSTPGWYEYKTERIGRLVIRDRGEMSVRLFPEKPLSHSLMYFKSIELAPADGK